MNRFAALPALAVLLLGLTLAACQPAAEPVVVNDITEMRATVQSVDRQTRQVLVRGDNGALETIVAGLEVQNFDQIRSGDRVVARVHEALAVQLARPGTAGTPTAESMAARAAPGASPAALNVDVVTARVRILAIEPSLHSVTFIGPAGVERRILVTDPKLQEFVRGLKVGDELDAAYGLAVAVAVIPVK